MVATGHLFPASLWWLALLIFGWFVTVVTETANGQHTVTRVPFNGSEVEGRTLVKTREEMFLLGRDGRLWHFKRSDVGRTIRTEDRFTSFSTDTLKRQLAQEFGRQFEVSATGQFIVVHPVGTRAEWPKRFDNLYRAFTHYFSARGVRISSPEFPLVAIVFHDQDAFFRYASQQGDPIGRSVLGYYSPMTNRIVLYDQNQTDEDDRWEENAATLIHEAAHQSAFNTGIHSRFAPPPRWVTEGLGTMFEAQGVSNSYRYPQLADRVNDQQRQALLRHLERDWEQGDVARLLSSDHLFEENVAYAYALAWGLSFYLAETQSREYISYLQTTADREDFTVYRSAEKLRDFTAAFGPNVDLIESRMIRFIEQLP